MKGELLSTIDDAEAFRFGGDEFAVLSSSDELSAYRQLERIQHELGLVEASPAGPVTISAGIASFPAHADNAEELQRTADGALYWSYASIHRTNWSARPSGTRDCAPRRIWFGSSTQGTRRRPTTPKWSRRSRRRSECSSVSKPR